MEQMEMSIKTEEQRAATFVVHTDSEITVFKQDPELLQSVKNEPSFNDARVKVEILEDSPQDEREHQCVHDAPTPAATGGVNGACSTSLGDLLNVKYESTEMDIGPTLLQDMDTINKNMSAAMEENAMLDDYYEATPGGRVKKESVEEMWRDDSEQRCLSTAAGAGSLYQADHDLSHGDCFSVKQELEDIDIGPTFLQHMDIHYVVNKKTGDDFNKAMRCSGVNQSVEDKLRDGLTLQKAMTKKQSRVIKSIPLTIHEHYLAALCRVHLTRLVVFQCDLCHEVHTEKRRLLQHLQTMHKRTAAGNKIQQQATSTNHFRCDTCGKTFRKLHQLSAHRNLHERNSATSSSVGGVSNACRSEAAKAEPKPFKRDIFDKGYSSEGTINGHKRFHTGIGMSVCRICSAKFSLKSNLTIHFRTHTGEKPYQCYTCNARFARSDQLTTHKRVHSGEKPYQCDTCNARFADSSNLITHKRVHSGEKPYQCETCNKRFTTSSHLTKHKRVHTGEKPYQCDICDARFTTSSHLPTHKRVHTGEKPYQCDTCNARFTTRSHLNTHKRVHSGEKPYKCDTCNARFTTNGDLTKHKRVHTGEKPFKCTECGDTFKQNSSLNTHVKSRHPK